MEVTKPYEFTGFGATDATKPYEIIGFGAIDVTKPYEFIQILSLPGSLFGTRVDPAPVHSGSHV